MRMRFDRFRSLLSKDEARRIVSNIAKLPRATKPPSDRLIGIIGFSGALQIADRGFTTVVGLSDTADARVGPEPQVPPGAAAYGTYNYYQGRRACGCAPYPPCY